MRVSSLSDDKVIDLLTKYFVPVWVSREHYQLAPPSDAEQDELKRIDRDRAKRGLEGGTVCVYVLAPDGAVSATMRVQKAYKPENLAPFLQKIVDDEKLTPRSDEAIRATAAAPRPPAKASDGRRHDPERLDAVRRPEKQPRHGPGLGRVDGGRMGRPRPGRRRQARRRADPAARRGRQAIPAALPADGRWDAHDCEFAGGGLTATVDSVEDGEVRLRLEGDVELKYPVPDKQATAR